MLNRKGQIKEIGEIGKGVIPFLKYVKLQEPGELALEYEKWGHLVQFFRALELYKLNIVLKSKQIGISWGIAARVLWKLMTNPGENILEISSGQVEAQKLLDKTKIIYHNLPEWLKNLSLYREPTPNSGEQFGFGGMKSLVRALPSTDRAGIGETASWVIHDEAEFHDCFEINLGHTLATVADNPLAELTVVSTVDKTKPDSHFKQLYKGALERRNSFHPLFFPYSVRPGRGVVFLSEMKKQNEATPWIVEANYPVSVEEALSPQSAQSCFSRDRLDKLWYNVIESPDTRQGFIYILYPPRVGTQYVAGVDVGEGVGLDYSCLTIVGKRGLDTEVCAVIYSNKIATDLFAYECDKLCREYLNALLAVENNSLGVAVTNKLLELGYPNLFYSDIERRKVGWTTGERNKQIGVVELIQAVNESSLVTRFKPQVREMMEYQWVNGKPEPTGTTHGDTVISLMLAHQMLKKIGDNRGITVYDRGIRVK